MSAGVFISSKYRATYGSGTNVHPIKIQPETTGLQFGAEINVPPVEDATSPISAVVSNSRRSIGLTPRKVSFRFLSDTPQSGRYKAGSVISLPWLVAIPSTFIKGLQGTYLGEAVELVSVSPERVS